MSIICTVITEKYCTDIPINYHGRGHKGNIMILSILSTDHSSTIIFPLSRSNRIKPKLRMIGPISRTRSLTSATCRVVRARVPTVFRIMQTRWYCRICDACRTHEIAAVSLIAVSIGVLITHEQNTSSFVDYNGLLGSCHFFDNLLSGEFITKEIDIVGHRRKFSISIFLSPCNALLRFVAYRSREKISHDDEYPSEFFCSDNIK